MPPYASPWKNTPFWSHKSLPETYWMRLPVRFSGYGSFCPSMLRIAATRPLRSLERTMTSVSYWTTPLSSSLSRSIGFSAIPFCGSSR